jgi:hypothetical protein
MFETSIIQKWKRKYIKLTHWEFWNFNQVYLPLFPIWIYFSLKAKSFFFFSASNPSILNGGMLNESKKLIHPLLPENLSPQTLFYEQNTSFQDILSEIENAGLTLPLVAKPNIGARGRGVKIIYSIKDLRHFVAESNMDFHLQEFIDFPNEVGIFYCKMPSKEKGRITGIVRKEFLSVKGNGRSTIKELMQKNYRTIVYSEMVNTMLGEGIFNIPLKDETVILSKIGNHARGAMFIDDSHLIDESLLDALDPIFSSIEGFYFGRLDIRFKSWDDFKVGKSFYIIELNGAGAEPTHMYDPKHSLFFAWKEIIRHWNILNKISIANHSLGYPYLSFKDGVEMFKKDAEISRKLSKMPI